MSRGRPPALVHVVAAIGAVLILLPLFAIAVRTPWGDAWSLLGQAGARRALGRSLATSGVSVVLSVVVGLPMAWVLARSPFPGRAIIRGATTLPMVLPPVVGGVALLLAFGRRGLAAPVLDLFGVRVPFTVAAVVLAQTFVAMPFLVVSVEAALERVDVRLEDAAATLGAGSWFAFRRVTLPIITPSVVAGAVLAWVRALGEFGATVTFAGTVAGRTVPVEVFLSLERGDLPAATALSVVLMAVSLAALVALRRRWSPT
ncbi:MAG: ABC transporter permease [Acidimicrobiales bacterium]